MAAFIHSLLRSYLVLIIVLTTILTGCLQKLDDENLYTFTGETIADYMENRPELYSDFTRIMKKSKMFSLLATRGSYTCFVPTNEAVNNYLTEKGVGSVDSLSQEEIMEIAYGHIIMQAYLTTDLDEGAIPVPNMNDRYLTVSFEARDSSLAILVNKVSPIIIKDQEVVNGVVQTISRVLSPSNSLLPDLMTENPEISLFNEALLITGLADSMRLYVDYDWKQLAFIPKATSGSIISSVRLPPDKKKYGFTALVETDELYRSHGINTIEDLIAYAKSVYDEAYPQDKNLYDTLYTHRKNPLNRFVAYHLINRTIYYNTFYYTYGTMEGFDCYDYYETLCPFTIIKTSDSDDGIRLNRSKKYNIKGIKVLQILNKEIDQNAINGIYHYIDDILVYGTEVREKVLNERIRVDASSMLPEMMNNGLRQSKKVYVFNDEYFDWLKVSEESRIFYQDPTSGNTCYQGDEFIIEGAYDVTIKLPPVPEGTYEVRFGYFGKNTRGIAQFYVDGEPCGIPLDLSLYGENVPKIGWERPGTNPSDPYGYENDKMMRNRGYMKGPNSTRIWPSGDILRYRAAALRRIVTTKYLTEDESHYFRARSVLNNDNLGFMFDYFELCPKSVYDSEEGEDVD